MNFDEDWDIVVYRHRELLKNKINTQYVIYNVDGL
jgi:hypothetical protein